MGEYGFRYGRKTVERLLDAVLSIEEHLDPSFFIRREEPPAAPSPAVGNSRRLCCEN
jgi:stage V sporulation protein R